MDHAHADVSKHIKVYIAVFIALAIGTVLTVAANHLKVSHAVGIGIALLIASVKATLVAAIFMHLKWEKSLWIWSTLAICAAFFCFLLFIPLLSSRDMPAQSRVGTWDVPVVHAAPDAHGSSGAGH